MRSTRQSHRSRRSRLARPLASVAVLALASALTACGDGDEDAVEEVTETVTVDADGNVIGGGDDGGDEGGDVPVLAEDQLQSVVLQLDNLGTGWVEGEVSDDDEESIGCLDEIGDIDDLGPSAKVEVAYEYGDIGVPAVETGAATVEDEAALDQFFTDNVAVLAGCTSVETTDDEGNAYSLTITSDETTTGESVDDQINLHAEGTITSSSGQTLDLSLHSSILRVGPNAVVVGTVSFDAGAADLHAAYTQIATDRLVAVVEGEEPPVTTAPEPA